ncbi:6-phospho-3-hexuloisomerase [Microbacterium indicum]|uniref:6-phospho-3-hexuloisomerase n=1 Tax=Microbacterium indicum TaxID=358100 RepID=UPI00048B1DF8|nr:6-phospho-3-hexuloisomerase [Microbacterium indicum]
MPETALRIVASEITALLEHIPAVDGLADRIGSAQRVFVHGAGRSGLALRMTAMRLMHLGVTTFVVGEVTTPAIGPGDLLLTASGSGTTGGIVRAAEAARAAGADVAAISTTGDSPLSRLASVTLVLPAAHKTDRSGAASAQYAGSLFEQGVVLAGDALFHELWRRSGATADELWPRHANLE